MTPYVGLFLALVLPSAVQAETVRVAVASNFIGAFEVIAKAYEAQTSHHVLTSSGATGRFYAQIKAGAPFDIFLAADEDTPRRLESEGLTVPATRLTYATGRLVLWSRLPQTIDPDGAILRSGTFLHLAIANPTVAPYGKAAVEVMKARGLYPQLRGRLVEGESIAQAYQFVDSGNAELGFIALSQVYRDGRLSKGSGWVVPTHLHSPLRQQAVLLRAGEKNRAARALLEFLTSPSSLSVLTAFGYSQ